MYFSPSSSSSSSSLARGEKKETSMKTSRRSKIERKSSIETEPRTLTLDQLQYAREAALYVLSTKTIEDAVKIFTEGLKPVLSIGERMDLNDDTETSDCMEMEHPNLHLLKREIASAPF